MMAKKRSPHIGSSFEDFLAEEGLLDKATAAAQKRVLAWQVADAIKKRRLSKAALGKRLRVEMVDGKK